MPYITSSIVVFSSIDVELGKFREKKSAVLPYAFKLDAHFFDNVAPPCHAFARVYCFALRVELIDIGRKPYNVLALDFFD